jgi:hypothetical protein
MKYRHIRPEHIEPGPDFAGFRVKLIQAGPHEYVAAIETEWGEELGRSPQYLPSPYAALAHAIESIEAHQSKGAQL